jgi:4-amino-4-deoxy-L-arabinose transferase-like glycosyltransferase
MPKRTQNAPTTDSGDPDLNLLALIACVASVSSFLFYYRQADLLLYGDAIAHINIARRVFDSKTPGLLQLGTVWLPLPHLLMMPFLISTEMWRRGVGGSIPSMAAYAFGVIGMFRLTRSAFGGKSGTRGPVRIAAWIAALVYAANPNLLYMQATAMGESLYLAFFLWALVYFTESVQGDAAALAKSAICLAAACLTRYDGWFLAAAMIAVAVVVFFRGRRAQATSAFLWPTQSDLLKFVLISAAAPALWLAYNAIVYRNPLEFANGPYSAKAIEQKTQSSNRPGHPGSGNLLLSARYFVKSAEANVAQNQWLQRTWLLLTVAAMLAIASKSKMGHTGPDRTVLWPLAFLLAPLPFYALSIAYGGVPIFVPNWWPFSHYNVRYGLQLLPAFAVALAVVAYTVLRASGWSLRLRLACVLGVVVLVAGSYASVWRAVPVSLQEARVNMRTRNQLQLEVASWLEKLPPDSTILMYMGDQVGALERAAIPIKRTINEGNHRVWKRPYDPDGLWERALADPGKYADYVLAFDGDPVWRAVHDKHLPALVELHVTGQPLAILYQAR